MAEVLWVPDDDNVDKNRFEASRLCLLTAYHTYVQNHAGYLIAIIVGLIAIFSYSENFGKINGSFSILNYNLAFSSIVFYGSLGIFLAALVFDVLRMGYWAAYADCAITISREYAFWLFKIYNSKYRDYKGSFSAPESAILQKAVFYDLKRISMDKKLCPSSIMRFFMKLKLLTAGYKKIPLADFYKVDK